MDAAALAEGNGFPFCRCSTKTKIQTHVLAIIGAVFFWFCFLCPYKENELGCPAQTV